MSFQQSQISRPDRFRPRIATTALIVVLSLAILPAGADSSPKPGSGHKALTNTEQLSNTLNGIEHTLDAWHRKRAAKKDAGSEERRLKVLRHHLDAQNRLALEDFKAIGRRLRAKHLPAVILQRQRDAVARYKKGMATLMADLDRAETATTPGQRAEAIYKTREHLLATRKKRAKTALDPAHLPTRSLKPNRNNKPRMNRKAFIRAGLMSNPGVKVAALGDFTYDKLPGASNPAYLAATAEVTLTPAIKAKAQELHNNPIEIFNWVHDRTQWLPTWGAVQNSDMVLQSRKGNAFDLASLLIALYRASGIPARYVHGTIDIPTDKFMNWAGGFDTPEAAWDYASSAGVPITAVRSGGRIISFRMEHIWVEAAIDFFPSRGNVNRSADTWVALDPSFKQYVKERGYDMAKRLNFDGEAFMMDYLTHGGDKTPYQYYSKQVLDDLNTNMPDWTLAGLYGQERVDPIKPVTNGNRHLLAASLPYKIVTRGYTAGTIPDSLRNKITIELANDPISGADTSYTVALSELGTDRLTLSYIPATSADDAVVNDYGSLFDTPAYLVEVKPVLRKAGVTVAVGAGATLGEKQALTLSFQEPTITTAPAVNAITAGSYSAIVFQGSESSLSIPSGQMQKLSANAVLNETTGAQFDDLLGQLLQSIGVQWFFHLRYERSFYATTTQVVFTRLPSETIATADLSVSFFLGIPRNVSPGPLTIDADTDYLAVSPYSGDQARTKDFMLLAGMTGSSWEHLVFEGFFTDPAVSSMKLLRTAADQGIPIYRINNSNIDQVLPSLSLAADDIADIQNGVNTGNEVVVSQSAVQIGDYTGVGLLVLDPQQGSGYYLISGGLAGGGTASTKAAKAWKIGIYNSKFFTLLARGLIVTWAYSKLHTPYGLGCKLEDRNYQPCEDLAQDDPNYKIRVDCSGLVAYAYGMIGFPLFHALTSDDQMRAIGRWDFGTYPSDQEVEPGDLNFWCCTLSRPPTAASHVGIYLYPGHWLAAQGNEVDIYSSMPSWALFLKHGSIFKY
jgi:cell wall-associated NlpC family hydrolase